MAPFIPERADVYSVRAILARCKLPNELTLNILDHARYWVERVESRVGYKMLFDEEFTRSYNEAFTYLAVNAIPPGDPTDTETPKLKEVEFLVVSHGKLQNRTRLQPVLLTLLGFYQIKLGRRKPLKAHSKHPLGSKSPLFDHSTLFRFIEAARMSFARTASWRIKTALVRVSRRF